MQKKESTKSVPVTHARGGGGRSPVRREKTKSERPIKKRQHSQHSSGRDKLQVLPDSGGVSECDEQKQLGTRTD